MDDHIPIPSKWPWWERLQRSAQHDPVEITLSTRETFVEKAHLSEVYPMTKRIRGRCLLLMNAEFPSRLAHETGQLADDFYTKRQGTYPDIRCMSELFQLLGFIIVKRINKTAKEMEEYLEMERHNSYHEMAECFVCVISSYGTQRHVFGTDGGKMTYKSILQKFDDFHCPALKGKPKLFFWQTNSGTEFLYEHRSGPISEDEAQISLGFVPWIELPPDMLLLLPNIPGFHSLMLFTGGVLFQTVVYIFERWAHKQDIQALLNAVTRLARTYKAGGWIHKSSGAVQVPTVYSSLRKKLYFFPGQYEINDMESEANIPEEIRAMPADSVDLYLKILETGVERRHSIRLMLVGLYAAGKTSLARRLMGQSIENVESTDGIEIHKGRCIISLEDGIWSTTNAEIENNPASRLSPLARGHSNGNHSSEAATPEVQTDKWNNEVIPPSGPLPERSLRTKILDFGINYEYIVALAVAAIACLYMMVPMTETWFWIILGALAIFLPFVLVSAQKVLRYWEMEAEKLAQSKLKEYSEGDDVGYRPFLETKASEQLINLKRIIEKSSSNSPSNRKDVTVNIWDFAGQFVYYSTHQLFLSPRAIYIVVLKLTKDLLDFITDDIWFMDARGKRDLHIHAGYRFWLRSLYNYGGGSAEKGNVILVGTHKDKLQGTEEDKQREIKKYFDGIGQLLQGNAVAGIVNDKMFAVNNLDEDNCILELRKTILEVAKSQPHWNEELPAKWIQLEDRLIDERKKGKFILTFGDIVIIDRSCPVPIYDIRQLKLFLTYQTRLGNLVYYDQEPIHDTVVLDPQWIVNAFCCLVADVRCSRKFGEADDDWVKMTKTAIMDESLASRIWRKKGDKSHVNYQKELLTYMEKLSMIAKVRMVLENNENEEEEFPKYFIPCLLRNAPDESFLSGLLEKNSTHSPVLCFVFEKHFLPPSVFHRLLAACVARWTVSRQGTNYLMFCGCGVFDLTTDASRHRLTILHLGDVIAMIISMVSPTVRELDGRQCDRARRFIEATLKNEFRRFRTHICTGRDGTISNEALCEVKESNRETNDETKRTPFNLRILCPDIQDICLAAEQEGLINVEELVSAYEEGHFSCVEHSDRNCPHVVRVKDLLKDWFPDKVENGLLPVESVCNRLEDFQEQEIELPLTDTLISRIAGCIGNGWERLGSELNLSVEIDHTKEDYPHDTRNQIFQMLKIWKQRVGREATLDKLMCKIKESACRVDEDKLKNAIEGIDTG